MRKSLILIAVLVLAGCKQTPQLPAIISPYRIDVQQGNVVTQEMVAKLKAGMTRSQVRFVLGSPLVTDMFHADRWDYVYLMQRQGKADERRRLTVIFDGDKLATIEGDVVLSDRDLEPAARHPASSEPPAKPAAKPEAVKPVAAPAPKPEVAKPALKPPAAKPEAVLPTFQKPATPAPAPTPAPVAKPQPPQEDAAPAVVQPEVKPDPEPVPAPAAKPAAAPKPDAAKPVDPKADAAKSDSTKPDAAKSDAPKTDAAKTDAAKAGDEKKDAPQKSGFGRMLEKIGF